MAYSHAATSAAGAHTTAPDRYMVFTSDWHFKPSGVDEVKEMINDWEREHRGAIQYDWNEQDHSWKVLCLPGKVPQVSGLFLSVLRDVVEREMKAALLEENEGDWNNQVNDLADFEDDTPIDSQHIQRLDEWYNENGANSQPEQADQASPVPVATSGLAPEIRAFPAMKNWIYSNEEEGRLVARALPELESQTSCRFHMPNNVRLVQIGGPSIDNVDLAYRKLDIIKKYMVLGRLTHFIYTEDLENTRFILQRIRRVRKFYFKTTLLDNRHSFKYRHFSSYGELHEAVTIRTAPFDSSKVCYVPEKEVKIIDIAEEAANTISRMIWTDSTLPPRGRPSNDPRRLSGNQPWIEEMAAEESTRPGPGISPQNNPEAKVDRVDEWAGNVLLAMPPSKGVSSYGNATRPAGAPEVDEDPNLERPEWDTYVRHSIPTLMGASMSGGGPRIARQLSEARRGHRAPNAQVVKPRATPYSEVPAATTPQTPQPSNTPVLFQQQPSQSGASSPYQTPPPPGYVPPHLRGLETSPSPLLPPAAVQRSPRILDGDTCVSEAQSTSSQRPISAPHAAAMNPSASMHIPLAAVPNGQVVSSIPRHAGLVQRPINPDFIDREDASFTDIANVRDRNILDGDISNLGLYQQPLTPNLNPGPPNSSSSGVGSHLPQESQLPHQRVGRAPSELSHGLIQENIQVSNEVESRKFHNTMHQKKPKPRQAPQKKKAAKLEMPEPVPVPKKNKQTPIIDPTPSLRRVVELEFERTMDHLRGFRGRLNVQIEFGRILLYGVNAKRVYEKEGDHVIKDRGEQGVFDLLLKSAERPKFAFTKVLTTIPKDIGFLLNSMDHDGRNIWNGNGGSPIQRSVVYQFHYRQQEVLEEPSGRPVTIIEINGENANDEPTIHLSREYSQIHVHCPRRHWDFRVMATGTDHGNAHVERYSGLATAIKSSLHIPSCTVEKPELAWELDNDFDKRFQLMDVRVRVMAAFPSIDGKSLLKITDVQSLRVRHCVNSDRRSKIYEATAESPNMDPKAHLGRWFEVAISCPGLDEELEKNERLELGEEVDWTGESLRNLGYADALCIPAFQMVRKMDAVGQSNDNQINMADLPPIPSTPEKPPPMVQWW